MQQTFTLVVLFVAIICLLSTEACTTYVVGNKATVDGSVMGSHTNDGGGTTDARIVKVDAADHAPGSMRPIYGVPENYPRYVGTTRNVSQYFIENCQAGAAKCKEFEPIGYIPQVEHTFAYIEATYGVMNEHQVGFGESTCSGVYVGKSVEMGGGALLSIDMLSQIAMERATTAREAIQIMGDLAVEYGFYGESMSFEGGSESLVVVDKTEGWVFHILADPTSTSAIWAAARVPDDSVAVVANMFSIREMDLDDSDNFMGSKGMWELAQAEGLWDPSMPKDFTRTFSDGEYSHKYYSGRRMWGIFNRIAPSQGLPSEYNNLKEDKPYPFAVPVDAPITVSDAFGLLRDWYEGSVYSPTAEGNTAGGAFGTPDRYGGSSGVSGSWERTIALYRSSDTFVVQARSNVDDVDSAYRGVVWFGPHAAHSTSYVPLLVGMSETPDCLAWAYQGVYNTSTSFWAHRNVLTIAQAKFSYMIEDIRAVQSDLEAASLAMLNALPLPAVGADNADISQSIAAALSRNAETVRDAYIALAHTLMFRYADGYINEWKSPDGEKQGVFQASSAGYPAWWLEAVGYPDGPPPVDA